MRQKQELKQTLVASAAQVMLSSIIEMPLADLEQHIANEIDNNEAIETGNDEMTANDDAFLSDGPKDEVGIRDSHTSQDDYDDFVTIDQVPEDMRDRYNDELRSGNGRSQYDGDSERQIADDSATSYDDIMAQIGELSLTEEEVRVMTYLVGSLDENGYLTKDNQTLIDELTFQEYIYIDEPELNRLIKTLQTFEPRGIGARDTRHCILLQMECSPEERRRLSLVNRLAHKIVRDMWEELSNGRWLHIQDVLDVDDETIGEIKRELHHYNLFPGRGLNESSMSTAPTVIADFEVYVTDDENISIVQNRGRVPEMHVSSSFESIVNERNAAIERARTEGRTITFSSDQEKDYQYAVHKIEAARAFIEIVRRRQHTLQAVMEGIVRWQKDFFIGDDDENLVRPMKLSDVAEYAKVDVSTVSRVVNSKYVRTKYGTYPLKHFFSSEFINTEGDSVSQRQALNAIRQIIEGEDPRHPYSDQRIAEILAEQGTTIARRTVAKYRERLGYGKSTQRRQ